MKRLSFSARLFWVAGALVMLVNFIILAGVSWNRSGENDSRLLLSERELDLPYRWDFDNERSALSLSLKWRVVAAANPSHSSSDYDRLNEYNQYNQYNQYNHQAGWLDGDRLRELGFDIDDPVPSPSEHRRWQRPERPVWLVLEFDGEEHARAVAAAAARHDEARIAMGDGDSKKLKERTEIARDSWLQERDKNSRLFVIDAGLDPEALRQTYPDRHRMLIVRGRIAVGVDRPGPHDNYSYLGYIRSVEIDQIHIPARFHGLVGALGEARQYTVDVAWGRRHEPWVVSMQAGDGDGS